MDVWRTILVTKVYRKRLYYWIYFVPSQSVKALIFFRVHRIYMLAYQYDDSVLNGNTLDKIAQIPEIRVPESCHGGLFYLPNWPWWHFLWKSAWWRRFYFGKIAIVTTNSWRMKRTEAIRLQLMEPWCNLHRQQKSDLCNNIRHCPTLYKDCILREGFALSSRVDTLWVLAGQPQQSVRRLHDDVVK